MPQQKRSTKEQINNLIEFRQAIYENGLRDYRDAQFELIDALLANQRVNSFAELSLSPLYRRAWASAYMAIEAGNQETDCRGTVGLLSGVLADRRVDRRWQASIHGRPGRHRHGREQGLRELPLGQEPGHRGPVAGEQALRVGHRVHELP